jgi:hypothetical protein
MWEVYHGNTSEPEHGCYMLPLLCEIQGKMVQSYSREEAVHHKSSSTRAKILRDNYVNKPHGN